MKHHVRFQELVAGAALVIVSMTTLVVAAPSASFDQRDGTAEARADIAAGRPTKLYSHVYNGRAPRFRTPGIQNCEQSLYGSKADEPLFALLPEAFWAEGSPPGPQFQAAAGFARDYNREMFEARSADILAVCPEASRED